MDKSRVIVSFIGMDRDKFEYQSVIATMKCLPDVIFENQQRITTATNLKMLFVGKLRSLFFVLLCLPRSLSHKRPLRLVSNKSLVMKGQ